MHLDPTLQGHRRLNILCFWTGHNVGRPDGTLHGGAPGQLVAIILAIILAIDYRL